MIAEPEAPVAAPPRRLRTDVVVMLANKTVVLGGGIVSSVVVTRALGADGRGGLAVAVGFSLILVQLGSLGFQTANPYYAARPGVSLGRLTLNSIALAALLGAGLVAIGVACKVVAPATVQGLSWPELLVALCAVPAMLAMLFLQGILLGEGRTVAYSLVETSSALVAIGGMLVYEAAIGLTLVAAIAMTVSGYVLSATACLVLLARHHPLRERVDWSLVRQMVGYAARIYLSSLIAYVVVRLDVLLVNGFISSDQAGYYTLAVALADMLYIVPTVVAISLFPRVARGGDVQVTAEVFRSVAALYALLVIVAAALAPLAIRILYGPGFHESAELFWWLAPGAWAYGVLNILNYHLAARGFPREILLYWLGALVLNVALNVALLPGHGTYIASVTSTLAYGLLLATHARLFAQEAGGYGALVPRPREVVRFVRGALSPAP